MSKTVHDILAQVAADPNVHPAFGKELGKQLSKYRLPPGECSYCNTYRNDSMMPSHTASNNCESGKRDHCTCDTCY